MLRGEIDQAERKAQEAARSRRSTRAARQNVLDLEHAATPPQRTSSGWPERSWSRGSSEDAVSAYEAAVAISPGLRPLRFNLGGVLRRLRAQRGRDRAARGGAQRSRPTTWMSRVELGLAYMAMGANEKAIAAFDVRSR